MSYVIVGTTMSGEPWAYSFETLEAATEAKIQLKLSNALETVDIIYDIQGHEQIYQRHARENQEKGDR